MLLRKMMKIKIALFTFTAIVVALFLSACHQAGLEPAGSANNNVPDPPVWTLNDSDMELGTTDFYTFDIEHDYSQLNEKLFTDPKKKMYVENFDFKNVVAINFNGEQATVTNDKAAAVRVETSGAHVTVTTTKDVAFSLSGDSQNGSLKILGDNSVRINLHWVNLKNPSGPAITCQSKQTCFVVTDSQSTLADDGPYPQTFNDKENAPATNPKGEKGDKDESTEKLKGCLCARGYLAISGKAQLKIVADGANAIHSGKTVFIRRGSNIDIHSHAASAIKAKKKVKIEGGVININSTGPGGHGIAAKKEVEIAGGRVVIISNTGAGKDGKNSRGIKSDSIVAITGGVVRVKESSVGGKGIRAGHRFLAKHCIVDVLTYGNDDKATGSKNRGIKAVDEVRIDSARVRVRTENGWNEGISTRYNVNISNSLVEINSRDDAISAGDKQLADVEITNSRIYADAGMDAIDSNGTVHVHSGLIFVIARSHLCRGFDCDTKEFEVGPDAIIVSLGQQISPPTERLLQHPLCVTMRAHSDPQFCLSTTGKDDNIVSFDSPKFRYFDTGYNVFLSVPQFRQNVSYDFCRKATVKPEHTFHGLRIGGTATDKAVAERKTFTKNYHNYSPPLPKYIPPTAAGARRPATDTAPATKSKPKTKKAPPATAS